MTNFACSRKYAAIASSAKAFKELARRCRNAAAESCNVVAKACDLLTLRLTTGDSIAVATGRRAIASMTATTASAATGRPQSQINRRPMLRFAHADSSRSAKQSTEWFLQPGQSLFNPPQMVPHCSFATGQAAPQRAEADAMLHGQVGKPPKHLSVVGQSSSPAQALPQAGLSLPCQCQPQTCPQLPAARSQEAPHLDVNEGKQSLNSA
mmetsp:Transcript_276/g.645  ORF Transcript_276/g.645 Transcript_276/m.645 type:complete len:209 (-) Transcript_276:236-862(-)